MAAEVTQIQSWEQKLNFTLAGFNFQSYECNISGQEKTRSDYPGHVNVAIGQV